MSAAGVAVLACASCLQPPARACQRDDECELDQRRGECRGPGYCVYPTDRCPSRQEFGPYAGEGLAGQCFEGSASSGSDAGASTTDPTQTSGGPSTTGTTTDGTTGSTTGDGPISVVVTEWVRLPSPGDAPRLGALGANGSRVAVAATVDADAVWLTAVDEDGTTAWTLDAATIDQARGEAVAVGPDGMVWVAGNRAVTREGSARPYVAHLAADGTITWQKSWDTLGADWLVGAGVDASGVTTVVGTLDDAPWLSRLEADGTVLASQSWGVSEGITAAALAVTAGGLAVIGGPLDDGYGVRLVNEVGVVILESDEAIEPSRVVFGIAAGTTSIAVVGRDAPFLSHLDYEGAVRWSLATEASSLTDVAVDTQGGVLVVGSNAESATTLWRFRAEGEQDWAAEISTDPLGDARMAVSGEQIVVATVATGGSDLVLWTVGP